MLVSCPQYVTFTCCRCPGCCYNLSIFRVCQYCQCICIRCSCDVWGPVVQLGQKCVLICMVTERGTIYGTVWVWLRNYALSCYCFSYLHPLNCIAVFSFFHGNALRGFTPYKRTMADCVLHRAAQLLFLILWYKVSWYQISCLGQKSIERAVLSSWDWCYERKFALCTGWWCISRFQSNWTVGWVCCASKRYFVRFLLHARFLRINVNWRHNALHVFTVVQTVSRRSYPVAASIDWNSLPPDIQSTATWPISATD